MRSAQWARAGKLFTVARWVETRERLRRCRHSRSDVYAEAHRRPDERRRRTSAVRLSTASSVSAIILCLSEAEKAEQGEHKNHDQNDPENRHSSSFRSSGTYPPAHSLIPHGMLKGCSPKSRSLDEYGTPIPRGWTPAKP